MAGSAVANTMASILAKLALSNGRLLIVNCIFPTANLGLKTRVAKTPMSKVRTMSPHWESVGTGGGSSTVTVAVHELLLAEPSVTVRETT